MAEQINIKVLIDAAEAAKTVGETRKALKDLKSAALQVDEGSQAFQQLTQASGQLQDKMKDLQATTQFFADDMRNLQGLTGIATGIAGGFAIAQGAAQLFGSENKALEKSLIKLNAIMAILNGLTSVGNILQRDSAAALFVQNATRRLTILLAGEEAVAKAALAVENGVATNSQLALNAAMNANPIGILITLFAAGAAALTFFSSQSDKAAEAEKKQAEATKKLKEAQQEEADTVAKSSAEFIQLIYQLQQTNYNTKERKDLIDKVNSTYGLTLQNLKDEKLYTEQLNGVVAEYITYQRNKYKLQKNDEYFQAQLAKQEKAYNDLYKAQKNMVEGTGFYMNAQGKFVDKETKRVYELESMLSGFNRANGEWFGGFGSYSGRMKQLQKDIDDSQAAMERLTKRHGELLEVQDDLTNGGKKYEVQTKDNTKSNKENAKSVVDMTEAYKTYSEYLVEISADANELFLESQVDTIENLRLLREEQNRQEIEALKKTHQEKEDAVYKDFQKVIAAEKGFEKAKQEVIDAEAQKRLDVYLQSVKSQETLDALVKATKERQEKELTAFIEEETKKRRDAYIETTKAIISPDEFMRFVEFSSRFDVFDDAKITLEEFTGIIKDYAFELFYVQKQSGDTYNKLSEDFITDIQNNGAELTKEIDNIVNNVYEKPGEALKRLFAITNDELAKNADAELAYSVKLGAIYQDKFKIIEAQEKKNGVNFQNFTLEQNVVLKGLLEERYNAITKAEQSYYDGELYRLYQQLNMKYITEEEYTKKLEKLQQDHADNQLDIDVAYGVKNIEDLVARQKERLDATKAAADAEAQVKKEAADAELETQKKLNDQLLSLEAELQQGIMDLYQQRLDRQNYELQKAYNEEIDRIDAAEEKYKDSIANRTAAEQAQLDIERGFDEQRDNAKRQLQIQQDQLGQRAFEAQKINDATTIAIQTAVAVATTIAELGGIGAITPAGIALIAAIVAQGAVQEALVLSKQYVPTAFAKGGLVSGPGSGTSDSIPARLSNGESVINAKSTRMFAPLLSAINEAGGGRAIPHMAMGGLVGTPMVGTQPDNQLQRLEDAILSLSERPVETYVKQTVITNAQETASKIKRRTTFG